MFYYYHQTLSPSLRLEICLSWSLYCSLRMAWVTTPTEVPSLRLKERMPCSSYNTNPTWVLLGLIWYVWSILRTIDTSPFWVCTQSSRLKYNFLSSKNTISNWPAQSFKWFLRFIFSINVPKTL